MEKDINVKKEAVYFTEEEERIIAEENFGLIHHIISGFSANSDVRYDDLFDAGQFGYAKAIKTFDKSKNILFSTYACNCIRNEVLLFLKKEQLHMSYNTSLFKDVSVGDGRTLELEEILANKDHDIYRMEDELTNEVNREIIMTAIKKLTPEEQFLILHRFGLGGKEELLQKDIADLSGMSQANISKMEKRCLRKLKFFLHQKL